MDIGFPKIKDKRVNLFTQAKLKILLTLYDTWSQSNASYIYYGDVQIFTGILLSLKKVTVL